jgi:1-acyl-sn-glycerol-3-phosphate acyltransferase
VTPRTQELIGRVLCGAIRFVSGINSRWVDCVPSTRQRVYYGNHSSHLDIVVLWSSLPREIRRLTRPVAARDYWETSRLRKFLVHNIFNAIMIDRSGHGGDFSAAERSLEATLDGIGDRYSLIIFPEGTRGSGDEIAPFKSGIYHIAKHKPGIEFVPVYLENLNRILPKGEVLLVPVIGSISFGRPLVLGENEARAAFLERARQALLDLAKT